MAGTEAGGKKAAATILAKNPNFYREIGRKGGSMSIGDKTGFALNREAARICGRISNADLSRMTSWLNSLNLTQSEKTIQTCTKTVCMRGLEIRVLAMTKKALRKKQRRKRKKLEAT